MSRLVGLAALVTALLLGGLAAPAAAAPAAPTDLSPSGGATVRGKPAFEWGRVPTAAKYELEVSDATTARTIVSVSTVNTRYVPHRYLPEKVEWQVRAVDAKGVAGAWSSADFTMQKADKPVLTPLGTTPLAQPENPPLLTWSRVRGAEEYIVEVSRDDFLTSATYRTETTSLVVPNPVADGAYAWRVTADFGDGILSERSDSSMYVVGPLSDVRLLYPQDTQDFKIEDVVFDWAPVPGAVTYELWTSTDDEFNEDRTVKVTGIKGTRYSPPTTYLNDQYFWKVRAVNAQKETIDWLAVDHKNFQRHWPDAPELIHPLDQLTPAVGDPLYYEWSAVEHASHYELDLGTDPNFSPGTYVTCRTASTTFTPGAGDRCTPTQGTVYYWRVRGIDEPRPVQGIYSKIRRFVYDSGPVTQAAPAPGAEVSVPTLRWHAARDAETYLVTVTDANGRTSRKETYALSWTASLDPADGPFTWTVQAVDADGKSSPLYPGRSFSIAGTPPTTGAAELTPLTGTSSDAPSLRFPSLSWEPKAGAAYYKVSIGVHGSGFFFDSSYTSFLTEKLKFPAGTDGGSKFLNPGAYDWFVTAHTSTGAIMGSGPVDTFTISDLPSVTGHRLALTGTALDEGRACEAFLDNPDGADICTNVPSTPVLEWDPVPEAASYMVYLARDRELTNLVYPVNKTPTTTNTRWTPSLNNSPSALPESQAGKPYHWIVRPCKASGVCAPDPISTDAAATHAFDKRSPAPVGLTATTENDIQFEWQDYLATNLDTPYDETGEPSYQSATQYRVEVSTTDSFTSLIDSRDVDQTTYTAYDRTYPEGTLWWRVQAIDDDGNHLTWSAPQRLWKDSGVPQLIGPVGGAETDGLAPLRWAPQDFAKTYTVEVYANDDDETWSPANLVFRATTQQTALAWDEPIPASAEPYVWRVRRNDADGRAGFWSATGRFRSTGEVPTLLGPDEDAYITPSGVSFQWADVLAAANYRFERRLVGTTRVVESRLTRFNEWVPTSAIADGVWEWRVTALDSSDEPIGVAPWRRFVVDGQAPVVLAKAPTRTARVASTFSAKFSEPVRTVTSRTFIITRRGTTRPLPGNVTLSANGLVAKLNPSANLKRGQIYVLKLTSGITDAAGNRLAPVVWKVTAR